MGEVDDVIFNLQKPGSRFDDFFPDWIPSSISSSICNQPHQEYGSCVSFVSNNTAIHEVFDRCIYSWDLMYKQRSYLHVFEQDGIHRQDMSESRNLVQYISDQYKEYATWQDKLLDDKQDGEGRFLENKKAIANEEQATILNELRDLRDCYIHSTS